MKRFATLLFALLSIAATRLEAQVVFASGAASGTTQLVPFNSVCINTGTTTVPVCGINASFQFTSSQCCACPTSGMVCLPGSVGYGGPGSSASFTNYHTLSYSPSNEHQRLTFSGKINTFQWRASGPNGPAEPFQIQVRDGGVLVGTFSFTVPGTGLNNTYNITGPQFDQLDFVETNAISADDELFGDFRVATAGCPLAIGSMQADLAVLGHRKVRVHWVTENETDLRAHELHRSADGFNWEVIDVQLARNTEGPNHYAYTDAGAVVGTNYYRIVTSGHDGYENYSNVLEAQFTEDGQINFMLFPNPASDKISLHFAGLQGEKQYQVVSPLGQVIVDEKTESNAVELSLQDLSTGMYYMVVRNAQGSMTKRFEVSR